MLNVKNNSVCVIKKGEKVCIIKFANALENDIYFTPTLRGSPIPFTLFLRLSTRKTFC